MYFAPIPPYECDMRSIVRGRPKGQRNEFTIFDRDRCKNHDSCQMFTIHDLLNDSRSTIGFICAEPRSTIDCFTIYDLFLHDLRSTSLWSTIVDDPWFTICNLHDLWRYDSCYCVLSFFSCSKLKIQSLPELTGSPVGWKSQEKTCFGPETCWKPRALATFFAFSELYY